MFRVTSHFHHPEDPEAFLAHYRSTHSVLAAKLPGLRYYAWGLAVMPDGSKPPHFLVTVLDWDSKEEALAALASPEAHATNADTPLLGSAGVDVNFHEVNQVV